MFRIITVCTGNICRSPMAQLMLAEAFQDAGLADEVSVDSAGTSDWETGRPIDVRAAAKLDSHGIASSEHRARMFGPAWYTERDLILALDLDHYQQLRNNAPDDPSRAKVRLLREFDPAAEGHDISELGIYDPWFGDAADFGVSWDLISAAVPGIVEHTRRILAKKASDADH